MPIPAGRKAPKIDGWQKLRLAEHELSEHFYGRQNVGILLGSASGGLVDVDLDCPEAVALAREMLPRTGMIHGRSSKPSSHYWYIADPLPTTRRYKDLDGTTLIELRSTGGQTVVPPSTHVSGEEITWQVSEEPERVDGRELLHYVRVCAAGAFLARHWPSQGSRDDLSMALTGGLLRAGWNAEDVDHLVRAVARVAGDEEWETRGKSRQTSGALSGGRPATGWPSVREILGREITNRLTEILEIRDTSGYAVFRAEGDPEALTSFNLTDAGNGEAFAHLYSDRVRYDHARGRWLVWHEHWWEPDADGYVGRLAVETTRARFRAAAGIDDLAHRERIAKFAIQSENTNRREGMLKAAQSIIPIADSGQNWDADRWSLGVPNGRADVRTAELYPGRPEDRITMHATAHFDMTTDAPRWMQFLQEIFEGDRELIAFVQRALGYSLTGLVSEQCLFICYGTGSNGKSTFLETIRYVLGDYAYAAPFSTLEQVGRSSPGSATPELASLANKRFVTAIETNKESRLNEARVKALTGGDPITTRELYGHPFTFMPAAKFWVAVNHKPRVQDDSYGFWRRVRLIPFTRQFTGSQMERGLEDRLKAEKEGILAWMMKGCLLWQEYGLEPPEVVRRATEEYRRESDPLGEFLTERCVIEREAMVKASELYKAYREWAEEQGMRDREQMTSTAFGRTVGERFTREHRMRGKVYIGLRLMTGLDGSDPSRGSESGDSNPSSPKAQTANPSLPETRTDTSTSTHSGGIDDGLTSEIHNFPHANTSRVELLQKPVITRHKGQTRHREGLECVNEEGCLDPEGCSERGTCWLA